MKSRFVFAAAVLAFASTSVFAQPVTPVVKERQENQSQLIKQGVASGELTKKEASVLRAEQRAIRAKKKAFKADGVVTPTERAELRRDQNVARKRIYDKKHNAKKLP
jgi:hypothetical protein